MVWGRNGAHSIGVDIRRKMNMRLISSAIFRGTFFRGARVSFKMTYIRPTL